MKFEQLFLRTPLEACFCSSNCFYRYSLSMNDKVTKNFQCLEFACSYVPALLILTTEHSRFGTKPLNRLMDFKVSI